MSMNSSYINKLFYYVKDLYSIQNKTCKSVNKMLSV